MTAGTKLFVGNLPAATAQPDLEALFLPYGAVLEAVLLPPKGRSVPAPLPSQTEGRPSADSLKIYLLVWNTAENCRFERQCTIPRRSGLPANFRLSVLHSAATKVGEFEQFTAVCILI